MNRINAYNQVNTLYKQNTVKNSIVNKSDKKEETSLVEDKDDSVQDKKNVTGMRTYGDARLSDTALEYYKKLTSKYSNLNFVLVSADKKREAEMMKGSFASSNGLTVLIDTDKIEKMASDEKYAKQIESVLNNASTGINNLKASLQNKPNVKSYGMSIQKDNRASFFATIDKQMKQQRQKIQERREKKKEEVKAKEKTEAKDKTKEEMEARIKDKSYNKGTKITERKTWLEDKINAYKKNSITNSENDDTITIEANSVEELIRKIEAYEKYVKNK